MRELRGKADAKVVEKGTAVELIGQVATVYNGQGFVLHLKSWLN